jgi:hypothetical protein
MAVPIPCDWPKAPGQISTTKSNRSAYLIDGGLWRACKESREVIAKHTHFEDWVRIQKRAIVDIEYFHWCSADWSGGNESPHPAIIDTCDGEEECRMLVYPAKDIFCIQMDDWIDLQKQYSDPDINMLLMRHKRNGYEDDCEDDYEDDFQKLQIKNIALEFDSSWLVDLPDDIYDLANENSARGYLTHLLKTKAFSFLHVFVESEGIWIVDKEAKWFNNPKEHHNTVYRDCDGEYIEVHCNHFLHSNPYGGEVPNAAVFLYTLDRLGFDYCYPSPESYGDMIEPRGPEAESMVRLLVRRDKEVKEITERCKRKCDRLGWCICSDDEGECWEDEDESDNEA